MKRMNKWFLMIVSTFLLSGCNFSTGSDKKNEEQHLQTPSKPFKLKFERIVKDGENPFARNVYFTDGIEMPNPAHDYLLFGKVTADLDNTNHRADDALYMIISADGTVKTANYVRFVPNGTIYGDLEETFLKGRAVSYRKDGKQQKDIVLVGNANLNGQYGKNGIFVTLLDEDGAYKWSKGYYLEKNNDESTNMHVKDLQTDSDGTIWILANGDREVLLHIDIQTGDILMARHFGLGENESEESYAAIKVDNDEIYLTGSVTEKEKGRGILLQEIDKTDGTSNSAHAYILNDQSAETGAENGLVVLNDKLYLPYALGVYGTSIAAGGVMKIDPIDKSLVFVKQLYSLSPYTYFRDFDTDGEALYLDSAHYSFYKIDQNGTVVKTGSSSSGWKDGLFIDSNRNIVFLSNDGAGGWISSYVTKFTSDLQYCGINTNIGDPTQEDRNNMKDTTNEWTHIQITPTNLNTDYTIQTENNGQFESGTVIQDINTTSLCDE